MTKKADTQAALPVLHYSTGSGWATLGHATSAKGAASIIRRHLSDASNALLKAGFKLDVFKRSDIAVELNGGPQGFVWSIGKVIKH